MTEGVAGQTLGSYSVVIEQAPSTVELTPGLRWKITQVVMDLVTVFVAAMGAYGLYLVSGIGRGHYDPIVYLQLSVAYSSLTVFALHGYGAYRDEQGLLRIEAVRKILQAVFGGVLLTLGLSFLIKFTSVSRLTVVMLGVVSALALVAQRSLMWKLRDRARATHARVAPVIIYGAGETGRRLAQHLLDEQHIEVMPVGFLDDDSSLYGEEIRIGAGVDGKRIPVLGGEESIAGAMRKTGATTVFLATPSASSYRLSSLVSRLESSRIPYFFVPSAGDMLLSGMHLGQLAGIPVFTRRQAQASRTYEIAKRVIDVFGAAALMMLSAPVVAISALCVRISSPGPVFFAQTRIGLRGRPFKIYKLRTMRQDAPPYAKHPDTSDDDRITWIGSWLRRLSIDELPQFYNVLKGEMSLVGPRPEMPFVVKGYDEIQRQRLTVKPGLTGLWQISADRAFTIHENLQYDLFYIERRSASLDMAILFITPFVVLAWKRTT